MQHSIQFTPMLERGFSLAECPRWDWRDEAWLWVDIANGQLWRLKDGQTSTIEFGEPIGCFAMAGDTGFVIALKSGLYRLDSWAAEKQVLAPLVSEFPRMRYNDGRAAPGGRFIAGTRNGAKQGDQGQFHQLHLDGKVEALPMFAWTCNGLAFSPDGQWLYWADTGESKVYRCSYNSSTGAYGDNELFADLGRYEGRPDGASVDSQGNYWVAMYAGASVVQIAPSGEVLQVVSVPAENPTMVGFGGKEMTQMVVTSAAGSESEGQVLTCASPVSGLREPLVDLQG